MGGHLHPWEGGEKVDIFINGELIKSSVPMRTSNNLWSWVTPGYPVAVSVQPGDEIAIAATYSNPYDIPIIGAMGMLGFYFAPDK